ncbi:MAG: aromatic ring-hydroxylating dioxygenase subunit alpha [Chloroflexota bacterium]
MITQAQNIEMTHVEPGTPCGDFMRRYWQPAALIDELPPERPVKAVRLLGENLVLFKDEQGGYGLMQQHCPHRAADLAYGRLEDGGLRCTFHGWLFNAQGKCLEQPPEPIGSKYFQKVDLVSYPVVEKNGILWTYMGPGRPPAFPAFDCFEAPNDYVFAFKGFVDCNWLQVLEVGIDPSHASFLHRVFEDEDPAEQYGKQFRDEAADSGIPITRLLREYYRPEIIVETTDFGARLIALRQIDEARMHVRVTNQVFPHGIIIPMSNEMTITQWHVPIDTETTFWYAMFTSYGEPVNKPKMREQRLKLYTLPDYKPLINKSNNYGFSVEEQKNESYTGMGEDINVHDQWAVESQGQIHDRTREHLARSDVGIITYRKLLQKAIKDVEQGIPPLLIHDEATAKLITEPGAVDSIGDPKDWQNVWQTRSEARRNVAPWIKKAELNGR